MTGEWQPDLVAPPEPTAELPGRCWLPSSHGAAKPCRNAAAGLVRDWLAPLDPASALPSCAACAEAFGLDLELF